EITMKKPHSKEKLQQAIDAVRNGLSMRKASVEFAIPYGTIRNRLNTTQSRREAFSP
ncbi:hypothetical protein V8F06_012835, partial [Rhypophila decipiens]